jgi:twinkle protein
MADRLESDFLHHIPCESCGSRDNNSLYSDGHEYCYGCGAYKPGEDGEVVKHGSSGECLVEIPDYVDLGYHKELAKRKISLSTCQFFDYTVGTVKGHNAQFAPYYDKNRNLVGYHVKMMMGGEKTFRWLLADGVKMADLLPYGALRFRQGGRKVVVTEGELDSMTLSQIQEHKWPVVSIPTGAGPQIKKYLAHQKQWFERFEEVIIMFDADEPGRQAAQWAVEILGHRCKVAELMRKDPNEMLQKGLVEELISAIWSAKAHRPAQVVALGQLRERVLAGPTEGLSFPIQAMTDWTYGIRLGEIHTLGAGTGIGKTDLFCEIALHLVEEHNQKIGMVMLEQEPHETAIRLTGKRGQKRFHIPSDKLPIDAMWTQEQLVSAFDAVSADERIFLYDSFGCNSWEDIQEHIRFLRHAEGVRYFFIDHLTALADWQENPTGALGTIMAEMGGLVKELGITIFLISHLNTPDGKPHEEGGRVMIRHFRGSRAIGFWSHFLWALERDQQSEDEDLRHVTTIRCLKDRYTGNGTGQTALLGYNKETGCMYQMAAAPKPGQSHGFRVEDEENPPQQSKDELIDRDANEEVEAGDF